MCIRFSTYTFRLTLSSVHFSTHTFCRTIFSVRFSAYTFRRILSGIRFSAYASRRILLGKDRSILIKMCVIFQLGHKITLHFLHYFSMIINSKNGTHFPLATLCKQITRLSKKNINKKIWYPIKLKLLSIKTTKGLSINVYFIILLNCNNNFLNLTTNSLNKQIRLGFTSFHFIFFFCSFYCTRNNVGQHFKTHF